MKKVIAWTLISIGSILGVAAVVCIVTIVLIPVGLVLGLMALGFVAPGLAMIGRRLPTPRRA